MAPKKKAAKTSKRAAKQTADEKVEVATASLLSGNMPKIRDLNYHLSTIAGYIDKARTASAKVTEAKKKAKEAGVDVSAIMEILAMKRADVLDVVTKFRQLAALMTEEGMPVQITLFEPAYGSIEERAAKLGYDAGINGRSPPSDIYPEGTPGSVEMLRAWNDAQRQLVEDGQKNKGKQPDPDFDE